MRGREGHGSDPDREGTGRSTPDGRGARGLRADELLQLLYDELRQLAAAQMRRERADVTLQPTALVHEAWLRLAGDGDPGWDDRAHFLGAAARAMRRVLIEAARARGRLKRGGDRVRLELEHVAPARSTDLDHVLLMEEALAALEARDPRQGRIAELRWFAGLSNEETARVLEVSLGTVEREWRFIRAYLRTALGEDLPDPGGA